MKLLRYFFILIVGITFISGPVLISCSNPVSSDSVVENGDDNGDDDNGDDDNGDDDNGDDDNGDDDNGDDDNGDDDNGDDDNGDDDNGETIDPHGNEFYLNHEIVVDGTILVDNFTVENAHLGSNAQFRVKFENHFQRTILIRVATHADSSIIEYYAPVTFSWTDSITVSVPSELQSGFSNMEEVMFTIMDTEGTVLYHNIKWFHVQL